MKRFWTILLVLSMLLACYACPALAAETAQQDGLVVTLLTDRDVYGSGELIRATLSVQNTNPFAIRNIYTEIIAPEHIMLTGGERTFIDELAAGKTLEKEFTAAEASPDVPALPQTGDNSHIGMWLALLILSFVAGIYLAVFRKNGTSTRWLSLFLCVLMLGALLPVSTFAHAEEATKTITVTKTVLLDDQLVTLTGIVTYEATGEMPKPTATPTTEPTATPTTEPTATPTTEPTATPTTKPTATPTTEPTATPTTEPTATPTTEPTATPTTKPTATPTTKPTATPTTKPTATPTTKPTATPTTKPTATPTTKPTPTPTVALAPTPTPTTTVSLAPTPTVAAPTATPTFAPAVTPTSSPSHSTRLFGCFDDEEYFVEIGEKLQLTGYVESSPSAIERVTINVAGYSSSTGRLMTKEFGGDETLIELDDYSAFRVDTAKAPFNQPGTYTLTLWASTADGTTLTTPLATAEVTVTETAPVITVTKPVITNQLGVTYASGKIGTYSTAGGMLTLKWTADNAAKYKVVVVGLNEEPDFSNSSQIDNGTILYDDNNVNWMSVAVSVGDLQKYKYLKVAIGAYDVNNTSGQPDVWTTVGIKVVTSLDYTAEVERINKLIVDTYATVRANDPDVNGGKGYGGYGGISYCGRFVGRQAVELGFIYKNANGETYKSIGYPNGNDWCDILGNNQVIANTKDNSTYIQKKYGGSNCLQDLIEANGGGNVYNIIISYNRWEPNYSAYTEAGHVRYIYAILKNPATDQYMVFFTDNMTSLGKVDEGNMVSTDLDYFAGEWIEKNRYVTIGAIHFEPYE